jgi:predicted nucleotidyltransferase
MDITPVLNDLVTSIKPSDPYQIVLFGSHATGTANADSDIDLMVILDNDHVSKTYDEWIAQRVQIRQLVREINYQYALDLLVYSKEEFRMVKEYGNSFLDEVERTGEVIYEKRS